MSGFFKCQHCGAVDIVDYNYPKGLPSNLAEQLCCICRTGFSHDLFEIVPVKENDYLVNEPNGIGLG